MQLVRNALFAYNLWKGNLSALFCAALIVAGCQQRNLAWDTLLSPAGKNRPELEGVLRHYAQSAGDSLKLKAAIFLLKNMRGKYYYRGEQLAQFFAFCDSISTPSVTQVEYTKQIDNYYKENKTLVGHPERYFDMETMSGQFLIDNIDRAFDEFNQCSWHNQVSFDDFCDYILPYKLGSESPEEFRDTLISSFNLGDVQKMSREDAANAILAKTSKRGMFLAVYPGFTPDFPLSSLLKIKGGTCNESSKLSIYIMRSCGLPVANDFTPQWPHRANSHSWSALLLNNDSCIDFEGVNANKVGGHLLLASGNRIGKIYRHTFSIQDSSLAEQHGIEEIPKQFNDPCVKDVSDRYFKGVTISLNVDSLLTVRKKFSYLSVFDNANWIPIAWAPVRGSYAKFSNLGKNVVYLPTKYYHGKNVPAGFPILVDAAGGVTPIVPLQNKTQTVVLTRKYPILDWWDSRTLAMRGGKFQASNSSNFKDAITLYTIGQAPDLRYITFNVNDHRAYRYWRYLAADSSYGDIAEIEFLDGKGAILSGDIIGTPGFDPEYDKAAAFDKMPLTYFQGATAGGNWVGLDLGRPLSVANIRFLSRNDDNFINPTDNYELYYWKENHWQSLGAKKGNDDQTLVYSNAPVGALFLLRDHSKGKEERIFTYEKDKQVWW